MTSKIAPRKGTLAAIVGVPAAALLLTLIPREESGRTVRAEVAADGAARVEHVRGRQYLQAYLDIAGHATACDGIRVSRLGVRYTETQCAAMLEAALIEHAGPAMACTPGLRKEAMPYQIAAAVAHAYQFGVAGYCGSSIARNFNRGRVVAACDTFPLWNKARLRGSLAVVPSIERRMRRAREYCLTGTPGFPAETLAARVARWN